MSEVCSQHAVKSGGVSAASLATLNLGLLPMLKAHSGANPDTHVHCFER